MRRFRFRPHAVLVTLVLAGCESTQSTAKLDEARQHYGQSHFLAAERAAADAMAGAEDDGLRHEAAYLAGLSAYQCGHFVEAEQYLTVASDADDDLVAARADAMLGLIELHRQRPRDAAGRLRDAATRLEGDDARRAREFSRLADERGGFGESGMYGSAGSSRTPAARPTAGGMYTLQLGAFSEQPRAARVARDASALARRHGLEPVQVVRERDRAGRTLYLVQMGRFASESAADRMSRALGEVDCMVTEAPAARR
ncbi:MAG: SPOR domain-containing protein [Planctomycetota bacterium]|jgi:hypothetical protein